MESCGFSKFSGSKFIFFKFNVLIIFYLLNNDILVMLLFNQQILLKTRTLFKTNRNRWNINTNERRREYKREGNCDGRCTNKVRYLISFPIVKCYWYCWAKWCWHWGTDSAVIEFSYTWTGSTIKCSRGCDISWDVYNHILTGNRSGYS